MITAMARIISSTVLEVRDSSESAPACATENTDTSRAPTSVDRAISWARNWAASSPSGSPDSLRLMSESPASGSPAASRGTNRSSPALASARAGVRATRSNSVPMSARETVVKFSAAAARSAAMIWT